MDTGWKSTCYRVSIASQNILLLNQWPTLKANCLNVEKFLKKYIAQHGVTRNIRVNQARCFKSNKGNKVHQLCTRRKNVDLNYAPANNRQPIRLVERLLQTVWRLWGCIKLDPNQRHFNIGNSLRNISYKLRTLGRKTLNCHHLKGITN